MLKRVGLGLVALAIAGAVLVGIEILVALRREYLPTEPAFKLDGVFGAPEDESVALVVLGDSTAAGVGAGAPSNAYPQELARRLAADGFRVELKVLGVSGARVKDVLEEQVPAAIALDPDLVFIGIGANDVTHVTPLSRVQVDTGEVLQRLERNTDAEIVIAGAPDMRAPAFLEPLRSIAGWRGRRVTEAIEEAATKERVSVVELARQTGPMFATDPDRFHSADDFHPSAAGYKLWVDAIYPVLKRVLQN
jgi:lysophospholipase L1-like esterase